MSQHLISEKTVKQLSDSLILAISIILSLFILSCKSKQSHPDSMILQTQDSITVRKCILEESIKTIAKNSIHEFEAKIHKSPTVIVLDFFREDNMTKVSFTSRVNLFTKKSDMQLYNPSYYSGCLIDKTLVLILKNENTQSLAGEYINLKSDSTKFKIYFGGDLSTCEKIFRVFPNKFGLELDECPSSIHTD